MDAPPSPRWTEASNRIRPKLPHVGLEITIPPGLPAPLTLPSPDFYSETQLGGRSGSPRSLKSSVRSNEYISSIVPTPRSLRSPTSIRSSVRHNSGLSISGSRSPLHQKDFENHEWNNDSGHALPSPPLPRPVSLLRQEFYDNNEFRPSLSQKSSHLEQESYNSCLAQKPPPRPKQPDRPDRKWREATIYSSSQQRSTSLRRPHRSRTNTPYDHGQVQISSPRLSSASSTVAANSVIHPEHQANNRPLDATSSKGSSLPSSSPLPPRRSTAVLPPPPPPPMTTSGRKILQLTGYDPRFDRTLVSEKSLFETSSTSSSSGSVYSQPGMEPSLSLDLRGSVFEPIDLDTLRNRDREKYVSPTEDSARLKSRTLKSRTSSESLTMKDMLDESRVDYDSSEDENTHHHSDQATSPYTAKFDSLNLEDGAIYSNLSDGIEKDTHHLIPAPLTLRQKKGELPDQDIRLLVIADETKMAKEKPGIFATARDTMGWGIDALTSPSSSKYKHSPTLPSPISKTPSLKSPTMATTSQSPSRWHNNSPPIDASQSPSEPPHRRRFSGTIPRMSSTTKRRPDRPKIISNSTRGVGGPDTPLPAQEQDKREGFAEVYAIAKRSLSFKSPERRRRESLKKKIVVVGIADQSPGEFELEALLLVCICVGSWWGIV